MKPASGNRREGTESRRSPFAVRVIPLYAVVYLVFFTWWSLMVLLLDNGRIGEGLGVAYSLPVAVSVSAAAAANARPSGRWAGIVHFVVLSLMLAFYATLLASLPSLPFRWIVATPRADAGPIITVVEGGPFSDIGALVGIGFISAVISIMLYPMGGLPRYFSYRRPLFIAGVIFMPLFIALAAALRAPYQLAFPPPEDNVVKGYVLLGLMVGFWASAAWLASARAQGIHVPGLTVRPLLPFRPDFILPSSVLFVKGVILTGVGLMVMIHDHLSLPRWNWWGFALAFWGILVLIPFRGMHKMVRGRRRRMLGEPAAFGVRACIGRELVLFLGLLILLYGFVSAFKGFVPFQGIGVLPRYNSLPGAPGFLGLALIFVAFVLLVPVRAWAKTRLVEGVESRGQLFGKQLLLYAGVVILVLGYIQTFSLPKDATVTGQSYLGFYPGENPFGFALGVILFGLGAVLILGLRPIALRNELAATIRTMVGVVADAPERLREGFVAKRVAVLCRMPEAQRDYHVRCMLEGLQVLPEEKAMAMRGKMMEALLRRPEEERAALMRSMDKVLFGSDGRAKKKKRQAMG